MPYNYQPYQQNQVFMQPQMGQGYPTAMPRQGYEQPMFPNQQGYQGQNPQQNPSLVKVLSEAEAQSYPVAFGSSVAMLDTQQPKMYIKSVDMNGVPAFMKYRLIEDRDEPAPPVPQNMSEMYVTRDEYSKLCREHDRIMDAVTKIAERMGVDEQHEQSGS